MSKRKTLSDNDNDEDEGILLENPSKKHREIEREERMARLRAQLEQEEGGTAAASTVPLEEEGDVDELDEDEQMKRMMGFNDFGSTQGTKVEDNHTTSAKGAAQKHKKRKYRQYMNRKNGFNRPLDKME